MNRSLPLLCLYLMLHPTLLQAAIAISPQTFKVLEQAERLLEQKSYDQAGKKIQKQLGNVAKPLEQALLLRALASSYTLQGKNAQAASTLEQALATGALPDVQQSQLLRTLGQLYLSIDQSAKAVSILEQWLQSASDVKPQDYALLAQAYTQLKQYRNALEKINLALQHASKPPDTWLELRLALNYELKNYRAAATDAKKLIRIHPERERYWQQLAGLYQLSGKTMTAAAAMELERFLGFLDRPQELLNLISLLRGIHSPYLAALHLEAALDQGHVRKTHKHLDLLATLWTEAREFDRAINTLQQTTQLSGDGRTWLRLGQLYYEREDWQEAAKALSSALQRGGLKHPGQTWLLLGNVYLELKQLDKSRQAFNNALKYADSGKDAAQWLTYLDHLQSS